MSGNPIRPLIEPTDVVAGAIDARLARAATERVAERLFERDDTLWGPAGQPEVADRLGWLDVAERMQRNLSDLLLFAAQARDDGYRHVVVLGMGGSSLAPEVFRRSFGRVDDGLELHVLDSTDVHAIHALEAEIELEQALFLVSSKSGGTIEPLSMLHHFWELTGGRSEQFCAITDPGSGLEALAKERGFRKIFSGDPEIGGRYSALSPFGIVPAALAGYPVDALLRGGVAVARACRESDPVVNPGVNLGCVLGELALAGRDKLTFIVDEPVASFGLWVEQLTAESLGKHGKGILPVAGEPVGTEAVYGADRVIAYVRGPAAENFAGVEALTDNGMPLITTEIESAADLGELMMLWEVAIAVCGWVLELNPFDQPNVQAAKDKTNAVLAGAPPQITPADDDQLHALLASAPPSYLAIQAFTAPDDELDRAITELRVAIRARTKMATTTGYGPRYLHSTGQLHKGGPPTGRFLQLLAQSGPDIDAGNGLTFETLKRAQADGDLLVLREHGLPAERVLLGDDPVATIQEIKDVVLSGHASGQSKEQL